MKGVGVSEKVWTCKIGAVADHELPAGADAPMRQAVEDAFRLLTAVEPEFCFSGWGGALTEAERAVVEDREPTPRVNEVTIDVVDAGDGFNAFLRIDGDNGVVDLPLGLEQERRLMHLLIERAKARGEHLT